VLIPGFTAEVSLYRIDMNYWHHDIKYDQTYLTDLQPAFKNPIGHLPFPPSINASWQPPSPGLGKGFSGNIVVEGRNFSPGSHIYLRAENCSGPFPVPAETDASNNQELCTKFGTKLNCHKYSGGDFRVSISCECEGSSFIEAYNVQGDRAEINVNVPCNE
jgi:hypothetical protein